MSTLECNLFQLKEKLTVNDSGLTKTSNGSSAAKPPPGTEEAKDGNFEITWSIV